MFSINFWKQAMERAIKSAAQGLIGLWIGSGLNAWTIDVKLASGVAGGAVLLSVLTSIVSLPVGQQTSPSLVSTGSPSLVSPEKDSPSLVSPEKDSPSLVSPEKDSPSLVSTTN